MLKKLFEFIMPYERANFVSFKDKDYLSLDIEIQKIIPDGCEDWDMFRPFGITCAATVTSDGFQKVWYGKTESGEIADKMSPNEVAALIGYLCTEVVAGKIIVTWNGLSFDFSVLAEESGQFDVCKNLALGHIDMMFHLFCEKGYPLSLDKAAHGMGLPGKPSNVKGSLAPRYWAEGHRQEVINYSLQDAKTTLDLFVVTQRARRLLWRSNRNLQQTLALPHGWLMVNKALELPMPETSWMTKPLSRKKFTDWLTGSVKKARQEHDVIINNIKRGEEMKTQTRVTEMAVVTVKKLPKPYVHVFEKEKGWWWKFSAPSEDDEKAILEFLETECAPLVSVLNHSRPGHITLKLAIREIALTFGGTNILSENRTPILHEFTTIEEVETILRKLPHSMVMEIWYALGRAYPGWGPDISEPAVERKTSYYEDPSVGILDDYCYYEEEG